MNKLYDLQLFAGEANTQTTGHGGLSAEMKTYYGMELLENAKPQLVHNQFAATKPLPAGGGKTVEWRKFGSFDKALTPLTEGVTPDGSGISVSYITKELAQYGDYTTVSDMLDLTAIDDVVLEITDRHGSNMGLTLDTVTRNEIQQGNQVIYAPKIGSDGTKTDVTSRMTLDKDCRMTSELVAKAATQLKKMNAPTFEGKYVCIIHPSVAFDLRQDPAWVAADLLSQAEHDRLASPVLVTDSAELAKAVQAELEVQIPQLPRAAIARASVDDNGKIIVCSDLRKAIEACNIIAPEHLEVCVDDPFSVLNEIKNAGSIFLGRNVPEALGDYFAGPNHTLPTSGTARFSSPLGVDDFVKKSSFIYYTREALEKAAPRIADFAEREGLHAHARSVTIRYE